jgi:hypothetical protein
LSRDERRQLRLAPEGSELDGHEDGLPGGKRVDGDPHALDSADTQPNPHANPHADTDPHAHAHTNAYTNTYGNTDPHAYTNSYANSHANTIGGG